MRKVKVDNFFQLQKQSSLFNEKDLCSMETLGSLWEPHQIRIGCKLETENLTNMVFYIVNGDTQVGVIRKENIAGNHKS